MTSVDVTKLSTIEADAVYAIGDVHGRLDLLTAMESLIKADIGRAKPERPVICFLGDYIDRGPHSAQVIERLASPIGDGIERIFLKGNHEDRMMAFLDSPEEQGPGWMEFGGRETLASYGVAVSGVNGEDWWRILADLRARLPGLHLDFLHGLRVAVRWQHFLFVHAGLNPDLPLTAQPEHDLMWIREPFLSSERDWGVRVIHGHVIVPTVVFRPNRIGIDTGAYKSGRLTCLVVNTDGTRLLQTCSAGQLDS